MSQIINPSNGAFAQAVRAATSAFATVTGTIPYDDTIPQITEGQQVLSIAITPTRANNIIRARFFGNFYIGAANKYISAAIFRSDSNDAVGVSCVVDYAGTSYPQQIFSEAQFVAGVTTAITLSVRMGTADGTSFAINGTSVSRRFGGAYTFGLEVDEVFAP